MDHYKRLQGEILAEKSQDLQKSNSHSLGVLLRVALLIVRQAEDLLWNKDFNWGRKVQIWPLQILERLITNSKILKDRYRWLKN